MIVRFTSNKTGQWRDVTEQRDYQRAVLDLCGGGYTENQTARAMESLALLREGQTIVRGDFTIKTIEEPNQ